MTAAWNASSLTHTSKLVLLALADNANDAGICWPSIPKIAERCSLDVRTVYRAIATLEGGGHATTQTRPGKATIYHVHPVTPDSVTGVVPLTQSHPCQKVTPDTKSPTPDSLSGLPPSPPPSRALPPSLPPSKNRQEPSRRAPARARSRTVPEDFEVSAEMRKWAKETCPNVDIDAQTLIFRDHEFKDPHGNWPAAWRQWMRRAPEFARNGGVTDAPKSTWRPTDEDETRADR